MKSSDVLRNTRLAVTLIRSTIGRPERQRKIVKVLKLNKLHQTQVHDDGPRVWGMLEKVTHLIRIQRIRAEDAKFVTKKPNPLRESFEKTRWEGTSYR